MINSTKDLVKIIQISSDMIKVKVSGETFNYRPVHGKLVLMNNPKIQDFWKKLAEKKAFDIFCAHQTRFKEI